MLTPVPDYAAMIADTLRAEPRRMAIVFFHRDQLPGHALEKYQGDFSDYHGIIGYTVRAARESHPNALVVMLTDLTTQFSRYMKDRAAIVRLPLEGDWLMYQRSIAQQAFAEAWDAPAIHIDTDVLLCHSFERLFTDNDFDIGVTYRTDQPGMHINGGMLLCGNAAKFANFMADLISLHETIAENARVRGWQEYDYRCFRGAQMALACLLHDRTTGMFDTHWGKLAIFDTNDVNRTWDNAYVGQPPPALAFHFKGNRKKALVAAQRMAGLG